MSYADLLRILDGRFLPHDLPGVVRPVPVEGVRGHAMDTSHAVANQVVAEELEADAVDDAIAAAIAFFEARGTAFQWLAYADREPLGLSARLNERGFTRVAMFAAMALDLPHAPIPTPEDITVRRVDRPEAMRHSGILQRGFALPESAVDALNAHRSSLSPDFRLSSYLAFLGHRSEPIAYGESMHAPGTSVVLLGGAATEAAFRSRGAYRALLDRRLRDAHERAARTAVILAERSTSAPICARAGFREIAAVEAWAWQPA